VRYAWHIPYPVDVSLMNETIREVVGIHDFSAFKKKDEIYEQHEREV
jgi:tRNA U38,U39,U40 pseudouridine synthase TruA